MKSYSLKEHIGADMPRVCYVNGKRESPFYFDALRNQASREGRLECFHTICRQVGEGKLRRTNFTEARLP